MDAQQAAVDEFNRDLQNVWDALRPPLQRMIYDEVQTQLAGLNQTSGIAEISARNFRGVGFSINTAPGLTALGHDQVGLRVPRSGTWGFEIEVTIRVKLNLWFFRPTIDIPIRLIVDRLSMSGSASFDQSDPTRPTLGLIARPVIDFRVKLRSSNRFWNLLFHILSPIGDYFANKLVNDALTDAMPSLAGLTGYPGPIPADGAAPYTDSGQAMPFAQIARNVDRKIRDDHTPYGMLLSSRQDVADTTSWEEAYRDGGVGNLGSVVSYDSGGDSAIWTGHYLASQAFRYAATNGDPDALFNVRRALAGIDKLFAVNGNTGLLARNAAPAASQVGQAILARNNPYNQQRTINGVLWAARQGAKGITRDQYSGVVFGLSQAYDLVGDAGVKAECVRIMTQLLDFLIAGDWIINSDRPPLDAGNGSRGPLFWLGIPNQKLGFLLEGIRMTPGVYDAEFQRVAPMVAFAWIAAWGTTTNFDHYYKYNLANSAYYDYFKLEADQARWQEMHRAYRIMVRYVGHHRNAHFDLIETSIDPAVTQVKFPSVRESMRRFLRRRHREIVPAVIDLSGIVWQTFTFTGYSNPAGGGLATTSTATVQVPSEPLDFHLRRYSGNFHWQRDPFTPATAGHGNPRAEKAGLDVVLPYWMGKHFGCF